MKLPLFAAIVIQALACQARAEWPFQTGDIIFTSPSIADLDGDGSLEIVFSSWDGNAYCLDSTGNALWIAPLHDGNDFPPQLTSSPTLVDLDGNPQTLETILGSGRGSLWGRLYCLSSNGIVLDTFETPTKIHGSPLVGDLENDGALEVLAGNLNYGEPQSASLYSLRIKSTETGIEFLQNWSVSLLTGSVFGAPAIADFDEDGICEIVVSLGGIAGRSNEDSALYCLDAGGGVIWPFQEPGSLIYNTPAVADVDADGALDVVVAPFHGDLYCLNGQTGGTKWIFDHPSASLLQSPGVADFDPTKAGIEAVIASYGADQLHGVDNQGHELWFHDFSEWTGYSSPSIGDVDGDGDLEIATGTLNPNGLGDSRMYLFDHTGAVIWSKPFIAGIASSPALADLDGDGNLEIAFGCYDHKFYVLDKDGNTFVPNPNTSPTDLAPWPTYRQNNQRTGYYERPKPKPTPGDITGDGTVNVLDLLALIGAWGPCPPGTPPPPPENCPADLDANGTVNVLDLLMVIANWG